MRTGISREATSSPPSESDRFDSVETTLLDRVWALQKQGLSEQEIVEAVKKAEERHEIHLLGQFRDEDLAPRAA